MSAPISPPVSAPLVRAEDVRIGVYLADVSGRQLYCVMDLRTAERHGRRTRLAMLENAITEEVEVWEFGRLAGLRVVGASTDF